MTDEVDEPIKCGKCGYVFQRDDLEQESGERKLCPNCGVLNIFLSVKETLVLHEHVGLIAKKPSSKHKKNRADYESEQGIIKGKDGNLVYKKKVIDREHPNSPDSYVEYVRDKEGNIIVNKSEKLSEHINKSKRQND